MSENFQEHARQLVETFKQQLSKSGVEHVGHTHFAELEMLIESALASVSVQQAKETADQIQSLADALRTQAETHHPG